MTPMKEWTLMFYFASDNPLAPGVVSQLKAIKDAGYHPEVNVITQFDPQTVGTPTHVFDVNIIEKLKHRSDADIGFGDSIDPFVRNLVEDKLWRNQKGRDGAAVRDKIKKLLSECYGIDDYDPPFPPKRRRGEGDYQTRRRRQEPGPKESLDSFLEFCRENYPARHYMLFILGHGVVVGNDIFLFDEHADVQSLTLRELGEVLCDFAEEIKPQGSTLELISFHSCSVSALEVVYEIKGTATYMLATQGPAFVGSWPYRQILIRIFKSLRKRVGGTSEENIKRLVIGIFYSCLYNSTDFLLAGYSFDLCLCRLTFDCPPATDVDCPKVSGVTKFDHGRINELTVAETIKELACAIGDALCDKEINPNCAKEETQREPDCVRSGENENRSCYPCDETDLLARDLIQLAHLQAQSYWQESYTDLFDFCFCFSRLYEQYLNRYARESRDKWSELQKKLFKKSAAIYGSCCRVMKALEPEGPIGHEDDRYARGHNPSARVEGSGQRGESRDRKKLIIRTAFAGPANQYSHGLSIYFPWTEPPADNPILGEYRNYKFAKLTGWNKCLDTYFKKTLRCTRKSEDADEMNTDYRVCRCVTKIGPVAEAAGKAAKKNPCCKETTTGKKEG